MAKFIKGGTGPRANKTMRLETVPHTLELDSPETKSVLFIPPHTLTRTHKVIRYAGLLWVRDSDAPSSDKHSWRPVKPNEILDLQ